MQSSHLDSNHSWLALSIGNTHWKWAYFQCHQRLQTWCTPSAIPPPDVHVSSWKRWCEQFQIFQFHHDQGGRPFPPLILASVVPEATQLWQAYPNQHVCQLADIPLENLYSSLGIDRALALLGGGCRHGWPALVIDGGTALTFSGVDDRYVFQGGAIAPGLGLQLASLNQKTGALPLLSPTADAPQLWGQDTTSAILSGVYHGLTATIIKFCRDWQQCYPNSSFIFTGGDGEKLRHLCQHQSPEIRKLLANSHYDPHLIFVGMAQIATNISTQDLFSEKD